MSVRLVPFFVEDVEDVAQRAGLVGGGRSVVMARLAQAIVEEPWRENRNALIGRQGEQPLIAGNQVLGVACDGRSEHGPIAGVFERFRWHWRRLDCHHALAHLPDQRLDFFRRGVELVGGVSSKFGENVIRDDHGHVVGGEAEIQQHFAGSGGECGRQKDVGIKDDPHEMALKTSSSVLKPAARA